MERLVVTIKRKNKAAFTKELLKSFDFLEIKEEKEFTKTDKKLIKNLAEAFKEVKLAEEGKIRLKTGDEVVETLK